MNEYTPTRTEARGVWCAFSEYGGLVDRPNSTLWDDRLGEFDRMIAEIERAATEKALTDLAGELTDLSDGGRWGVRCHSKSSASAETRRQAIDVVLARAAACRKESDR